MDPEALCERLRCSAPPGVVVRSVREVPSLGPAIQTLIRSADYVVDASGTGLLVGGCFVKIGDEDAEFLARWDGTNWRPVMTGLDHCVNAIVSWNGGTYLGGSFTRAGLGGARYLVRWEE